MHREIKKKRQARARSRSPSRDENYISVRENGDRDRGSHNECFLLDCDDVEMPVSGTIQECEVELPVIGTRALDLFTFLQQADGTWLLSDKFSKEIRIPLDVISKNCPVELAFKVELWTTLLAIAFLKTKFAYQQAEWELLVEKAQKWIRRNFTLPTNSSYKSQDEALAMFSNQAQVFLQANCKSI